MASSDSDAGGLMVATDTHSHVSKIVTNDTDKPQLENCQGTGWVKVALHRCHMDCS
jgi:hypothetical protein